MATSTEYFGYDFYNLGPLTTTFTAPSSCATVNTDHVKFFNTSAPYMYHTGRANCDHWTEGDCSPSGSVIDSIVADIRLGTTTPANSLFYHSPGIACPSGWDTVGLMAKSNGTLSVSGFMTETFKDYELYSTYFPTSPPNQPRHILYTEVWGMVLKSSETIAFCGPTSGYDINPDGRFISTIGNYSDYDYKIWCYTGIMYTGKGGEFTVVSTVPGITYEPGLLSWVQPSDATRFTESFAITGSEATSVGSDFAVVTMVSVIPLIFQQSDLGTAATSGTSTEEPGVEKTSNDNDAESKGSTLSVRRLVPGLAAFVSMLATAGLLAPWG
ncbi:hypothetical protein ACHAP7_005894 [Fusarium lateritium]